MNFESSDALKRLPKQFFSRLRKKSDEVIAQGHDVIDLGVGNPDTETPEHIVEELKEASENPAYTKYGPYRGYDFLKEAAADFYMKEYGVQLDPQTEIAVLHGSKSGIFSISQVLLNPGDEVLVPNPFYPDYFSGLSFANAKIHDMPLYESKEFLPDYSKIEEKIAEKAKVLFLNYPNNPTGAVATKEFYEETVEFAKKYKLCVVQDFAYGTIGFDGNKPISFLETPGAKERGIEFFSLSKSHNLAGWRIAFAVGNPSVIEHLNTLQEHTDVGMYGGIQQAAARALKESQKASREITALYEYRRDLFLDEIKETDLEVFYPKGTFYIWMKTPDNLSSEEFFDVLLNEAHVAVASGNGFGSAGEGYVRIGLCQPNEKIVEAARRIKQLYK